MQSLGIADAVGLARTLGLEEMSMKPPEYPSSAENGDTPFEDVFKFERHWFYDDVTYVYENGLMLGTGEDTFEPMSTTTRAMVVTLLYRIAQSGELGSQASFDDVCPEEWYYDEVEWAYANGVTAGISEGLFGPEKNVTRE